MLSRKVEDLQVLEKEKTMSIAGVEELNERNNELENQLLERNKVKNLRLVFDYVGVCPQRIVLTRKHFFNEFHS